MNTWRKKETLTLLFIRSQYNNFIHSQLWIYKIPYTYTHLYIHTNNQTPAATWRCILWTTLWSRIFCLAMVASPAAIPTIAITASKVQKWRSSSHTTRSHFRNTSPVLLQFIFWRYLAEVHTDGFPLVLSNAVQGWHSSSSCVSSLVQHSSLRVVFGSAVVWVWGRVSDGVSSFSTIRTSTDRPMRQAIATIMRFLEQDSIMVAGRGGRWQLTLSCFLPCLLTPRGPSRGGDGHGAPAFLLLLLLTCWR